MPIVCRAILIALVSGVGGCSGSGHHLDVKEQQPAVALPPPAAVKPSDPAEAFGMTYTVSFAGPMALSGTFSERVSSRLYKNCLDYILRRNPGTLDIEGATGGHDVRIGVEAGINGPGTFSPQADGTVNLVFDNDHSRYQFSGLGKDSPAKIVINADGSGTLTISSWKNEASESESGTVSWVCTK